MLEEILQSGSQQVRRAVVYPLILGQLLVSPVNAGIPMLAALSSDKGHSSIQGEQSQQTKNYGPFFEEHYTIQKHFPGAVPIEEGMETILKKLKQAGFTGDNSRLGFSTCPDEINQAGEFLETEYGNGFALGGLAGYPFTEETGFSAYAHHTPSGLVIVYGPHVGVDGRMVGRILRKGMDHPTAACGSAIAASSGEFKTVKEYANNDQQQETISTLVNNHRRELSGTKGKSLPFILYKEIHKEIGRLTKDHNGPLALVGIVEINTGHGSYVLPMNVSVINSMRNTQKGH